MNIFLNITMIIFLITICVLSIIQNNNTKLLLERVESLEKNAILRKK